MSEAARKLLDEVMCLPEAERMELAAIILLSQERSRLSGAEIERAWESEISRRSERVDQEGLENTEDWSSVKSRLMKKYAG